MFWQRPVKENGFQRGNWLYEAVLLPEPERTRVQRLLDEGTDVVVGDSPAERVFGWLGALVLLIGVIPLVFHPFSFGGPVVDWVIFGVGLVVSGVALAMKFWPSNKAVEVWGGRAKALAMVRRAMAQAEAVGLLKDTYGPSILDIYRDVHRELTAVARRGMTSPLSDAEEEQARAMAHEFEAVLNKMIEAAVAQQRPYLPLRERIALLGRLP